jgi:hypothetical protein
MQISPDGKKCKTCPSGKQQHAKVKCVSCTGNTYGKNCHKICQPGFEPHPKKIPTECTKCAAKMASPTGAKCEVCDKDQEFINATTACQG